MGKIQVQIALRNAPKKRRGEKAPLACAAAKLKAAKLKNAPSAASLYPRHHQRAVPSVSAPPTLG
jgi:hypothetical protein